jgi:hypothetical protein
VGEMHWPSHRQWCAESSLSHNVLTLQSLQQQNPTIHEGSVRPVDPCSSVAFVSANVRSQQTKPCVRRPPPPIFVLFNHFLRNKLGQFFFKYALLSCVSPVGATYKRVMPYALTRLKGLMRGRPVTWHHVCVNCVNQSNVT